MTAWLRRIHKWLGLLIGIQFLLWMASGVLMSLLDSSKVSGSLSRMPKLSNLPWPSNAVPVDSVLAGQQSPVRILSTGWLLGQPVFRLSSSKGTRLVDAVTGRAVAVDGVMALRLAVASYAGPGDPATPRLLARSSEVRKHQGHVWAVDFSDTDSTAVYVAADTGAIVAHRNDTWRLFDVFWMLHIMDYWDREDFNNPLVIGAGLGGLWLALSGFWLLMTSLRLAEFVPSRFSSTRVLELFTPDGVKLCTASGKTGDTVFAVLSTAGFQIPSQCGGGQSCGLCMVRVRDKAPAPTSGDAANISPEKLAAGFRLACNLALNADMNLDVPEAAALGSVRVAVVHGIRDVSPSMREIVLTLEVEHDRDFWPGSYVQIEVPPYETTLAALGASAIRTVCGELTESVTISNGICMRRSYSLSRPAGPGHRTITLLVRLMGAQQASAAQRFGVGSAYMFSLREGDRVQLTGPFGEFSLREGAREKIFIGGGAGMAPLRAMITHLLAAGETAPIHLWYGSRTLAEAPYLDEMATLSRDHGNFNWQLVVSDEPVSTGAVLTGLVHLRALELFLAHHTDLLSCDFYVCGPPAMLHATRQMLAGLAVPDANISFDDFKI